MDLQLIRPSVEFKESFLGGFLELTNASERAAWNYLGDSAPLDIPEKNFNEFVKTLLLRETKPPSGFVCDSVYWAVYPDCEPSLRFFSMIN